MVYAAVCRNAARNRTRIDIAEFWADHAEISRLAHKFGLLAVQPFGIRYQTFIKPNDVDVKDFVLMFKPLLTICSVPCTAWSTLNWNCNYARRRDELRGHQEKVRHQVRLAVWMAQEQMFGGRG